MRGAVGYVRSFGRLPGNGKERMVSSFEWSSLISAMRQRTGRRTSTFKLGVLVVLLSVGSFAVPAAARAGGSPTIAGAPLLAPGQKIATTTYATGPHEIAHHDVRDYYRIHLDRGASFTPTLANTSPDANATINWSLMKPGTTDANVPKDPFTKGGRVIEPDVLQCPLRLPGRGHEVHHPHRPHCT